MEMLMELSVAHTGTHFVRNLLAVHCDIETVRNDLVLPKFQIPSLPIGGRDCVLTDTIKQELRDTLEGTPQYALFWGHIETGWYLPILFHAPFEFKLIAPIRHPYRSLRSYYLRDKQHYTVMGDYLILLHVLKWKPDNFVLPVDLWGELSVGERFDKVTPLFRDYLGLPITSEVEQVITEWDLIGTPDIPYSRELTDTERAEIYQRIDNSRILEKLAEIGFDYRDNLGRVK